MRGRRREKGGEEDDIRVRMLCGKFMSSY